MEKLNAGTQGDKYPPPCRPHCTDENSHWPTQYKSVIFGYLFFLRALCGLRELLALLGDEAVVKIEKVSEVKALEEHTK